MQSGQKGEAEHFPSGISSFSKKSKNNELNPDNLFNQGPMQSMDFFFPSKISHQIFANPLKNLNDDFKSQMGSSFFNINLNYREPSKVVNEIIIHSRTDSTQKNDEKEVVFKVEEQSQEIHVLNRNKIGSFSPESGNESGSQSTKKKQKKKQLSESNAIKNFSNNFVKQLSNPAKFNDLKRKYQIDMNPSQKNKEFKNILDNIKKKIKYEKRSQKLQEVQSMISHKNKRYTAFLIDACQRYLNKYPDVISQSKKIKNKQENYRVIAKIREVIEDQRVNLQQNKQITDNF